MAWKQDLAKLKQQLGPETPVPARRPMPKAAPKPSGPAALDDEDAVFLSAMGLKPTLPREAKPPASGEAAPAPVVADAPAPETFQEAVSGLKGLKPLPKNLPARPASAIASPKSAPVAVPTPTPPLAPPEPLATEPPVAPEPVTPEPVAEFDAPVQPFVPLRFQLAAGMAIEVDGTLDLRGHSLPDAMERLKDRLEDGAVLGWRSLQVTLGPDPALHDGLLALLTSGRMPRVVRYAQAPVPMGGTQAWLLYFGLLPAQP
jgi:hypothetical protein